MPRDVAWQPNIAPDRAEEDCVIMTLSPGDKRRLAQRYAPHWRFNAAVPSSLIGNKDSRQNLNECYFPMSVDAFVQEVNNRQVEVQELGATQVSQVASGPLIVRYPDPGFLRSPVPGFKMTSDLLQHIDELSRYASQTSLIKDVGILLKNRGYDRKEDHIQIDGYPKYMIGNVRNAETYFYVYDPTAHGIQDSWGNDAVVVEYYLFYPYDTPGEFRVIVKNVEVFEHRSDWENIAVVISQPNRLGGSLHSVYYYGHFLGTKRVAVGPSLPMITGTTHPQVFVSWGTHACYPEPGAILNLKLGYDEFFTGKGEEIEAWRRPMVDLESAPWNEYVGMWGPDGTSSHGSALSPKYRGSWDQLWKGSRSDWGDIVTKYKKRFIRIP